MARRKITNQSRTGAALVEFSFVAIIFFLFVFGIFEYGRLFFIRHLMDTAAREGARFAVVNFNDATLAADTQNLVDQYMGSYTTLPGYTRQVYMTDNTGANLGPPENALFGQLIAVQIDADFDPVLPTFLFLGTPHLQVKITMSSEAN